MKNSYVDFTNLTFTKFMKKITFVLSSGLNPILKTYL